jgi:hypothetical protein
MKTICVLALTHTNDSYVQILPRCMYIPGGDWLGTFRSPQHVLWLSNVISFTVRILSFYINDIFKVDSVAKVWESRYPYGWIKLSTASYLWRRIIYQRSNICWVGKISQLGISKWRMVEDTAGWCWNITYRRAHQGSRVTMSWNATVFGCTANAWREGLNSSSLFF